MKLEGMTSRITSKKVAEELKARIKSGQIFSSGRKSAHISITIPKVPLPKFTFASSEEDTPIIVPVPKYRSIDDEWDW